MVQIIPCLKDNYAYAFEIKSEGLSSHVVVDAPDFQTIDKFIQEKKLRLEHLLITHHHWDHVGGILELKQKYNCKVYGLKSDEARIPGIDITVDQDEIFKIRDVEIKALHTPGHTHQHVIYYLQKDKILFTGDTLFSMGCGRLFEGTYSEMFHSLQKIKSLPKETQIFCGHEYAEKNAQFALSVDGNNRSLKEHYERVLKCRKKNIPTVPTSLELELQINPFLRASSVEDFSRLRQLRDSY